MNEFEQLLIDLKEHIQKLEETFIHQFIKNRTARQDYEHHVKAYCVLCHAAFEEYFESIAREVMNQCLEEWTNSEKYTDTLITFVSYYGQKFLADVDRNHGISLRYLKRLLEPIAIDITEDANLKNSLNRLARERGEYAHRRLIRHILAPEDARRYVKDCLKLCEDIKAQAENKFS